MLDIEDFIMNEIQFDDFTKEFEEKEKESVINELIKYGKDINLLKALPLWYLQELYKKIQKRKEPQINLPENREEPNNIDLEDDQIEIEIFNPSDMIDSQARAEQGQKQTNKILQEAPPAPPDDIDTVLQEYGITNDIVKKLPKLVYRQMKEAFKSKMPVSLLLVTFVFPFIENACE